MIDTSHLKKHIENLEAERARLDELIREAQEHLARAEGVEAGKRNGRAGQKTQTQQHKPAFQALYGGAPARVHVREVLEVAHGGLLDKGQIHKILADKGFLYSIASVALALKDLVASGEADQVEKKQPGSRFTLRWRIAKKPEQKAQVRPF